MHDTGQVANHISTTSQQQGNHLHTVILRCQNTLKTEAITHHNTISKNNGQFRDVNLSGSSNKDTKTRSFTQHKYELSES